MSQLGHNLELSMSQLGHNLELSMPQLGHNLVNYQCLNQDTIQMFLCGKKMVKLRIENKSKI